MSTQWMLGTAALLSFLVAGAANAQQEGKVEGPKAGEAAQGKPAQGKAPLRKKKAPTAAVGLTPTAKEVLVDAYGEPVTERLFDSKGKAIPFEDVPLKDAFLCYPPPGGARPEKEPVKEKFAKEMSVGELPKGYVCAPIQPEPHQVLRMMSLTCSPPYHWCVVSYNPYYLGCCR